MILRIKKLTVVSIQKLFNIFFNLPKKLTRNFGKLYYSKWATLRPLSMASPHQHPSSHQGTVHIEKVFFN